ncbi:iron ABC transporter permease [Thalassotalea sp. PP2-459]|uniref:ABC transporter permease n=1 Tax=Thalassotalea sp. PP2-459 TaxID=1742724 RepID=UPI000AA0CDD0|nr:iron ABC transporter permease [Thalassotalea sp. PP2-459]
MITRVKYPAWSSTSWLIALALMTPIAVMFFSGIAANSDTFLHLWRTVLPDYVLNTVLLAVYVVVLVILFGVPSAALISLTNLKTRGVLRWLLLLPLAMPAYVIAYLYTDLFDYAGPIQRYLRALFSWQSPADYWFFDLRTLTGAAVMIALVLFPYVYMLTRTAFEYQDQQLVKAARSLGLSSRQCFFKVTLPLARPAIAISASFVLMETLADFATVQYFAVNTLTTAIYDTWLEYGELSTANALASILMVMVLLTVAAEYRARAHQRHQSKDKQTSKARISLTTRQHIIGGIYCWFLVFAGFLLPFILLVDMAVQYFEQTSLAGLWQAGLNSLEVSIYVATMATLIAVLLGLYRRLSGVKNCAIPLQVSGFGYAVPGTVLAMAMLATFGPLDHWLNDVAKWFEIPTPGLLLSGSLFAIIFALVTRFAAIANGTIASGLTKIPKSLDLAPASLGVSKWRSIFKVHLPLLKSSIMVAWLLVFVEAMKELPAVLVLRPFNFDTLSTQVYQMISDERLEQGAIGALFIVLFGLLPIIVLNKKE